MLLQTANWLQLCTFVVHSSISERKKKRTGNEKNIFFNVKEAIGYQDLMDLPYDENISAKTDFSSNDRNSN